MSVGMDPPDREPAVEYAAVRHAPFSLYGLGDAWKGPRSIASIGYHNGTLNQVSLGHGLPGNPARPWVEVTVLGPLHGYHRPGAGHPGGVWAIDPDPLIPFFVATAQRPELTGAALLEIQERLQRQWTSLTLRVDGERQAFRAITRPPHWGAVRRLATDHALIICASHVEAERLAMERLASIDAYTASTA